MTRSPTNIPGPLPRGFLPALLERGRMLVCLDFDGTISEIAPRPDQARPIEGIGPVLTRLGAHAGRLELAIVTGRRIDEVRRLLGAGNGIIWSGTHGLELLGRDGRHHLAAGVRAVAADLDKARLWLAEQVPPESGFIIEDKQLTVALHYRMADPARARAVRAAFRDFVASEAPQLAILSGKMVDELVPRKGGDKGGALRTILRELGSPRPMPVYFGDDLTDEDAFGEVGDRGAGVLVGAARPSAALYRVDGPRQVLAALEELARALEGAAHRRHTPEP